MERSKRQGEYRYYGAQGVIDYIDDYIFDGKYLLIAEDGENLKSKKQNIVMQASVKLSKSVVETYFNLNTDTSGFIQLTSFYKAYEDIFSNHPDYFKFINELDAYIITENVSDKSEYETNINVYKEIFENAYKKGLSDNSVRKIEDISTFYYSTTHALLNLCKFLSTKQAIEQSKDVKSSDEIKTLISIILAALKGE